MMRAATQSNAIAKERLRSLKAEGSLDRMRKR
jgi:hypothetical protein